jgi:hypothetical protein
LRAISTKSLEEQWHLLGILEALKANASVWKKNLGDADHQFLA